MAHTDPSPSPRLTSSVERSPQIALLAPPVPHDSEGGVLPSRLPHRRRPQRLQPPRHPRLQHPPHQQTRPESKNKSHGRKLFDPCPLQPTLFCQQPPLFCLQTMHSCLQTMHSCLQQTMLSCLRLPTLSCIHQPMLSSRQRIQLSRLPKCGLLQPLGDFFLLLSLLSFPIKLLFYLLFVQSLPLLAFLLLPLLFSYLKKTPYSHKQGSQTWKCPTMQRKHLVNLRSL